jgi:DNA-binding CsgD family transcriptional regulator
MRVSELPVGRTFPVCGPPQGLAARTITALTLLGTDGFMSGDWGAAQQAADECLQACQSHGCPVRAWMPRTLHALLAAARGDCDIARELSEQIVQWALPLGIRQAQTAVHQVGALAALGRGDYEEAYQEAAAISPPGVFASHAPYALRVAMDLVEAAVRTGRSDEARAHVAAMRTARIARISPRRADNELRAGGLHIVRAGGHTLPSLTAQERQIASLAAGGLTSKEIGQRLRLSHRTVGGHLYQIFPKLGVTTRAALRDALTAPSPG